MSKFDKFSQYLTISVGVMLPCRGPINVWCVWFHYKQTGQLLASLHDNGVINVAPW